MLNPEKRKQLDGIVHQMTLNKEPDSAIQFVVNDFKKKYEGPQAPAALQAIGNVGVGAVKGVVSTGTKGSGLLSRIGEKAGSILSKPIVGIAHALGFKGTDESRARGQQLQEVLAPASGKRGAEQFVPEKAYTPEGTAQKLGFGAEQIGEFFLPGGAVAKGEKIAEAGILGSKLFKGAAKVAPKLTSYAEKALPLATRMGGEAATFAGLRAIQQGTTEGMGSNALLGAAFPFAGAVAGKVLKPIVTKLPSRLVNSVIKPATKDFNFGKNPGLAMAQEGITGNGLQGIAEKVTSKRELIGKQIGEQLKKTKGQMIDVAPYIKDLDTAMEKAARSGEQGLVDRIASIKSGMTNLFGLQEGKIVAKGSRNTLIPVEQAHLLKREVGEAAKWTGQAFDQQANQVRVGLYNKLNSAIESKVPGVKSLQARYGNLLSAEKSLEKTIATVERRGLVGMKSGAGAGLGFVTGIAQGKDVGDSLKQALLFGVGAKALESPAVRTRLAKYLAKAGKGERGVIGERLFGAPEKKIANTLSTGNSVRSAATPKESKGVQKLLPAPAPGAMKSGIDVPINLPARSQSTIEAQGRTLWNKPRPQLGVEKGSMVDKAIQLDKAEKAKRSLNLPKSQYGSDAQKIAKAREDIAAAKKMMEKAPEKAEWDSGIKTKSDHQKYIDDVQGWIDGKTLNLPKESGTIGGSKTKGMKTFYRGEGSGKGGNYFTDNKEFANEFAGTKPLTKVSLPESSIYRPKELPEAVNEVQVTKAIKEAKEKGYSATYVSEGSPFGEPVESVFVFDKSILKSS